MIVVKLMGGLGNQMFQYATGRQLAKNRRTRLYLDISSYDNLPEIDTPRSYELGCYKLKARVADKKILEKLKPLDAVPKSKDSLMQRARIGSVWSQREISPEFNPHVLNTPNNSYLHGWWQNEKYFIRIRDELREDFVPVSISAYSKKIKQEINNSLAVSIHVRRGDYVANKHANKFHGLAPIDYYKTSLKYFEKTTKDAKFFVFSDDIEWCRHNLPLNSNAVYVNNSEAGRDCEDIWLMSSCDHNIIANSSFSWWGAWLNGSQDKIVVAPKAWFQDKDANKKTGIVPDSWIRL